MPDSAKQKDKDPLAEEKVGPVAPPDPYKKFKDAGTNSKKWPHALKREYNQLILDAHADGVEKGNPKKQCDNISGSILSECDCVHCSGARGAYQKQVEVLGYDITEDRKTKGY